MLFRRLVLSALLAMLAVPAVAAGPVEQVAARLTAYPATILSERNGEVLIDAGSAAGVVPLDLFAVAGPGTPVVHPQTGVILGEVTETKAVLQVTWVKENFSGARRVRGTVALGSGDKTVRFGDLEARFVACATDAETLSADLRRAFPGLRWGTYLAAGGDCGEAVKAAQPADLVFVATATDLAVRDAAGNLLQRVERPAPVPTPSTVQLAPSGQAGAIASAQQERWYGGDWKGTPVAVVAGDFDGDHQIEIAVAGPRRISLGRSVNRNWQELGSYDLPLSHQLLALEAFDVDSDGRAELCVSAVRSSDLSTFQQDASGSRYSDLSSFLFTLRDGRLVEVQKNLPYIIRALPMDNGKRSLLGQEVENGHWSGIARHLSWNGSKLVPGETYPLPSGTGLRGLAKLTVDGRAALLRLGWNDTLEVLDRSGESLWQSDASYGGSETFIEVAGEMAQGTEHNTRHLYVQQRLQQIGEDQVLVPINIGSRTFNRMVSFDESQVQLVRWDGRTLRIVWQTPQEKGYLADCVWADVDNDGKPELAMLMAFSKEGMFSKGRYSLVVLEM